MSKIYLTASQIQELVYENQTWYGEYIVVNRKVVTNKISNETFVKLIVLCNEDNKKYDLWIDKIGSEDNYTYLLNDTVCYENEQSLYFKDIKDFNYNN